MAATTEPVAAIRQLSCQVNGEPVQLDLPNEDGLTLLDVLRDFLGITSPKNGCQPQAQCGCCTVLMDGKPVLSCALAPDEGRRQIDHDARRARRRASPADRRVVRPLRRRAVRLLHPGHGDARRRAVRQNIRRPVATKSPTALKPHLCRCTGYTQIVDSIEQYSQAAPRRADAGAVGR